MGSIEEEFDEYEDIEEEDDEYGRYNIMIGEEIEQNNEEDWPFESLSTQNEVDDQHNQNDNKIDEDAEEEDNKECEKCGKYFSNFEDILQTVTKAIREDIKDGRSKEQIKNCMEKHIGEKIGQDNRIFTCEINNVMTNLINVVYLQEITECGKDITKERIEEGEEDEENDINIEKNTKECWPNEPLLVQEEDRTKQHKTIEEEFGRDYLECYICKKHYKQSQKDEYYDHEDICGKDITKEKIEEGEKDEEKDTNIEKN